MYIRMRRLHKFFVSALKDIYYSENAIIEALEKMHERKINQFVVVDDANKVIGVISMHDLIQAGVN